MKGSQMFFNQLISLADYYDKYNMKKIADYIDDLLYVFSENKQINNMLDLETIQQHTQKKGSPRLAYYEALENGPNDKTREIVLYSPYWSYQYAYNIDQGPRDDTRNAVLWGPWWAFQYARNIDKIPREDTFDAVKNQTYYSNRLKKLINIEKEYLEEIGQPK